MTITSLSALFFFPRLSAVCTSPYGKVFVCATTNAAATITAAAITATCKAKIKEEEEEERQQQQHTVLVGMGSSAKDAGVFLLLVATAALLSGIAKGKELGEVTDMC